MLFYQFNAVVETVGDEQTAAHEEEIDIGGVGFLYHRQNLCVGRLVGINKHRKLFTRFILKFVVYCHS